MDKRLSLNSHTHGACAFRVLPALKCLVMSAGALEMFQDEIDVERDEVLRAANINPASLQVLQ